MRQAGAMDERTLRVLEYGTVRALLAERTVTPMGREAAEALLPTADLALARARQAETSEAVALLRGGEVPLRGAGDLRPLVHHARIGGVLEPAELLLVARTLQVARRLRGHLEARRQSAPRLAQVAAGLVPLPDLEAAIAQVLDEEGQVRDDASPALARIRADLRTVERRIREKLEEILRHPAYLRMLQEPLVTVRGDRFVVPVKVEARAQFPGLVHDQSSSGATVFMEPLAVVALGNRRRELEAMERTEVRRLLQALSRRVAEAAEPVAATLAALGAVDLALARAALSEAWEAAEPHLVADGPLELRRARHPLLLHHLGRERVVPIDVTLGGAFRTLVITGPNTGGKTVTLKTVGLLTLMAQAGLHIPAAPGSVVRVFPQVFADIGDEQSIEQSLSTFSSHLRSIVAILGALAPPALVLLDEIGAGTDPTEGAALARAIIETLHERGACTIVTTHYSELKTLAHELPGVENASVEFDPETLRPTFRLLMGQPGRSNAFIIAARLGLPAAVVERARGYLSREQVRVDELLAELTRDRARAERDREEAERLRAEAGALRERFAAEVAHLEAARAEALRRARREVEEAVRQARREVAALLEEARRRRTPEDAREARRRLEALAATWAERLGGEAEPAGEAPQQVEVGQAVLVAGLGQTGRVVAAANDRGEVEVEVGRVRLRVPLAGLRLRPAPAVATAPGAPVAPRVERAGGLPATAEAPSPSLSLRGLTVDDALLEVDRYLDAAVLAGLPRVTLIHGKGTGALRRAVQDFLRGHPHVRTFRPGGHGEGGEGVTVVELDV